MFVDSKKLMHKLKHILKSITTLNTTYKGIYCSIERFRHIFGRKVHTILKQTEPYFNQNLIP